MLQKPYVIQGTLRDQVRYPAVPARLSTDKQISLDSTIHSSTSNDEQVMEALHATDLEYLAHRGDGLDQIQVKRPTPLFLQYYKLPDCSNLSYY